MGALFHILLVNFLGTIGLPALALLSSLGDPFTHYASDYVLLTLIASVCGVVFYSWRWFCKLMAKHLPKDSRLQRWFESTWLSLLEDERT